MKYFEEEYQNSSRGRKKQKHKKRCITANVSNCKYDLGKNNKRLFKCTFRHQTKNVLNKNCFIWVL